MKIERRIPLVEEILGDWENEIGKDFAGYKNHIYRLINFCLVRSNFSDTDREKLIIAGCFHDLGIWSNKTFDYLSPSVILAKKYLARKNLGKWIPEIETMINFHHKFGKYEDVGHPLVEIFRKGDLVDLSSGFIKCGLPGNYIKAVKRQFPNAGFHKCLLRISCNWILRHPFNPLPVLKW